ncbi:MAG: hypothetical protein ABSC73_09060 [Acidimicrobiales bacterium]|jgi:hypothetical protein
MAEKLVIRPNDRYALVGKTGSGKSKFGLTLSTYIVREVNKKAAKPWQVWVVDTKGDPEDISRLRAWHYVRVENMTGMVPDHDGEHLYRYFVIQPSSDETDDVMPKAQHVFAAAKRHGNVLVNIDEYSQVVQSERIPGRALKDLFARGRGLRAGVVGQTQEPVFVPRQLASQATHLFLFDVSLTADIDWCKKLFSGYQRPVKMGYIHGFWYSNLDGEAAWHFFHHEREFYEEVLVTPDEAETAPVDTRTDEKV